MSKDFTEVVFSPAQFKKELDRFRDLLNAKHVLGEREIHAFFKASPQLTANLGIAKVGIGFATQVAYEFQLFGDYEADIVFGNREQRFCVVKLEAADPNAVLETVGKKSTKQWSKHLEHGFGQIVDCFYDLDNCRETDRFQRNFGHGHIDFVGLLLIGRNEGLTDEDRRRLRWRSDHVIVASHPIVCMTYDDLYKELNQGFKSLSAAFKNAATA